MKCNICGTIEIFGEHDKICKERYVEERLKADPKLALALEHVRQIKTPQRGDDCFP